MTSRELGDLMRSQGAHHRLRRDPVDDDTVLRLIELASHAAPGRSRTRCSFVVVRDPEVRHQLARAYRQGWSVYRRVLRRRSSDALLTERQWELDHFEDVPVLIVATLPGRRRRVPAISAAAFYGVAFSAVQNLMLAAAAEGLATSATTLPLWSTWEARRTLGLPRQVTPVSVVALGWPRQSSGADTDLPSELAIGGPVPPVGNLVHLDRWGHQPFRARHRPAPPDTA